MSLYAVYSSSQANFLALFELLASCLYNTVRSALVHKGIDSFCSSAFSFAFLCSIVSLYHPYLFSNYLSKNFETFKKPKGNTPHVASAYVILLLYACYTTSEAETELLVLDL
jgi:hypothetical protein